MKFPITEAQYQEMLAISTKHKAVDRTYQIAMEHHTKETVELDGRTKTLWDGIISDHDLNVTALNWEIVLVDSKPYVVSTPPEGKKDVQAGRPNEGKGN